MLYQKDDRHPDQGDDRAGDRPPGDGFLEEIHPDRDQDNRLERHQRAGDADLGVLDRDQREEHAQERPEERGDQDRVLAVAAEYRDELIRRP